MFPNSIKKPGNCLLQPCCCCSQLFKHSDLRHSFFLFFFETCVLSGLSITASLENSNVVTLTTELL